MSQMNKPSKTRLLIGLAAFAVCASAGTALYLMEKKSAQDGSSQSAAKDVRSGIAVPADGEARQNSGEKVGAAQNSTSDAPSERKPASLTAPSTGNASPSAPTVTQTLTELERIRKNASGCMKVSFQIDAAQKDAIKHSKNLLRLKDSNFNPKSVCVRVDGAPVKFKFAEGKKNELLIGAITKANANVTVQYCLGKTTCSETCVVPKDEFMEALAGEEEISDGSESTASWDAAPSKEDQEVEKELQAFKNHLHKDADSAKVTSDWKAEQEVEACSRKS